MEERYLTVTALTKYIKYKFDHDHNLELVLLEGEISNFKHNARGHFYFRLKDDFAVIDATMFASSASKCNFTPEDGMKVYVKGRITLYEPSGSYQINVFEMHNNGLGDLHLAYEKLKKELEEEGLFKQEHKKPIPKFPKTIGVITSKTGAAVRDIIKTITRRYPLANVILYPAIVQGEDAKGDIVRQIEAANKDNLCDVLIVGRGGGSIEDLWAFNERIVAYAIYNSNIPIISAVGHEIDYTIADFVADIRAVTPTAGAEIATPNISDLNNYLIDSKNKLDKRIKYIIDEAKTKMLNYDKILELHKPINIIKHEKDMLDNKIKNLNQKILSIINENKLILDGKYNEIQSKNPNKLINHNKELLNNKVLTLNKNIKTILDLKRNQFVLAKSKLELASPLKIMDKGYSISMVGNKVVKKTSDINIGDKIKTRLNDGYVLSTVTEVMKNEG